ncbi:NineTeen Complex (NTC) component [Sparganum proliferum]
MVKQKTIMHNYGNGYKLGIATEIDVLRGNKFRNRSFGFLHFDSEKSAEQWCSCAPGFKQHDWLDDVDVFVIPPNLPVTENAVVEIHLLTLRNNELFEKEFLEPYGKAVEEAGGVPFVVATSRVVRIRGICSCSYFLLTQWPSMEAAKNWNHSDTGKRFLEVQEQYADGDALLAQLTKQI